MDHMTLERRSWLMSGVKSKDTNPELLVRRLVYSMGYRYRLRNKQLSGKPDLVFPGRRNVMWVHGRLWHGHRKCLYAKLSKFRIDFQSSEQTRNTARDRHNQRSLLSSGWGSLIIWQCELKDTEKLTRTLYDFLEKDSL